MAASRLTEILHSMPEVTVTYQPIRGKRQGNNMMENLDIRYHKAIILPCIIEEKLVF